MLAIYTTAKPMVFKVAKPSFNDDRVPQGTTLGAKPRHKKHLTSSKQPFVSSSDATKGGHPKHPPSFKDLDSPEDEQIIVVDDSDEDEEANEVHATTNVETEDTLVPKSSSPSSLPTKLKELPSKFNELTEEVTKLKTLQWELLAEFLLVTTQVKVIQAKLKILDALPSLLHKVTNALNQFTQAIASKKTKDNSVPLAGQAGTQPAEGEKNTIQATTSYLPKNSSQPEREHIKKYKGKKALSLEEAKKVSTNSNSNDDDETHVTGSMVESSRIKKVKKFDFITKDEEHIHLTKEQINQQMKIVEEAKAKVGKHESEVRKEELVGLLGPEVVNKYYNNKLQHDRYCDKMLNRRA
nr:hypothetical protein [Tanacetum cinerariifolium]